MRQRWEVDELVESWSLDRDDLSFLGNKSGSTRLGFAVLMKFFELEARFPSSPDEVPVEVADFVAGQLGMGFDAWPAYEFARRTSMRHRAQIRSRFGFRAWTNEDIDGLIDVLVANNSSDRDVLLAATTAWCRSVCVEPPSAPQSARVCWRSVASMGGSGVHDGRCATRWRCVRTARCALRIRPT